MSRSFFGWRCWEGTLATGLACGSPPDSPTPPIYEYDHSVGISVTGGYVYRGCAIPELDGTYVFGDWSGGKIFSFRYRLGTGAIGFQDRTSTLGGGGGLTSFGTDSYGEIYYTRGSGEVRKIVPVTPQGPDCNANGRRDACDLLDGRSVDVNHNQVPDECECVAQAEVCDNLDNDCDGTIDTFATSCGVGACAATGVCMAGFDTCTAGAPATELCDGLDNDCDGTVDDVAAPDGAPLLSLEPSGAETLLSWTPVGTATRTIVRGDLALLASARVGLQRRDRPCGRRLAVDRGVHPVTFCVAAALLPRAPGQLWCDGTHDTGARPRSPHDAGSPRGRGVCP